MNNFKLKVKWQFWEFAYSASWHILGIYLYLADEG